MKRVKSIVVIVLSLSLIIVVAGCGCQNNSNDDNSNSTTQETNSSNTSQSDDSKSSTKTANSDFEPTISLEQRKAVKAEDYINGNTFDLTAYAEALGFTRLDDPDGGVIYAIKNGNMKCFFTYDSNNMIAWFDCGDGFTYKANPLPLSVSPADYNVLSKEQDDRAISKNGLDEIISFISYIATCDEIDVSKLPVFGLVTKYSGPAEYHPNGLMKVRNKGQKVETIICHPDN